VALTISRIDRLYRDYTVTATLRDGSIADLNGVTVALLPPRVPPTAATLWTTATYAAGVATVLLAGPDADPAGADVVVPAGGADLWIRVSDSPEIDAALVERISVQ
jgi:hypothetical protein